jgi:hypothetical protein
MSAVAQRPITFADALRVWQRRLRLARGGDRRRRLVALFRYKAGIIPAIAACAVLGLAAQILL